MAKPKDTRPGAEALRRLGDEPLRKAVEEYEQEVKQLPQGSEARSIVERLIEVGRDEIGARMGIRVKVEAIDFQRVIDEESTQERNEACIGIRAVAELRFHLGSHPEGVYALATISTPGLWGVEAGSGESYLQEIEAEQRSELLEMLAALGVHDLTYMEGS